MKLEPVKAPQLDSLTSQIKDNNLLENDKKASYINTLTEGQTNVVTRSNAAGTKRKKKRALVEWQIQPKNIYMRNIIRKFLRKNGRKLFVLLGTLPFFQFSNLFIPFHNLLT